MPARQITVSSLTVLSALIVMLSPCLLAVEAGAQLQAVPQAGPVVNDPDLAVEVVYRGLKLPTNMAFLGSDDILVLEKGGAVQRIVNGSAQSQPLLNITVASENERGMLGIAVAKSGNESRVFLYYTEQREGSEGVGNSLYRYQLAGDRLEKDKLLIRLPALNTSYHNGGEVIIGPDDNVYVVVGDGQTPGQIPLAHLTTAQNVRDSAFPDGTSGILRITQDGGPVGNLIGGGRPADLYYAYGIRNSFGMDFDPVTGILWNTENGPDFGDEINLVEPGFNSGWRKVQGFPSDQFDQGELVRFPGLVANEGSVVGILQSLLFRFQGLGGKYSDPEFVWDAPIAPTAIKFLDSDKLGSEYENDIFVGSVNNGNVYRFELDESRRNLVLEEGLADKEADDPGETERLVFASGFGRITDIQTGPDGFLYVLAFHPTQGTIFRIAPGDEAPL